MLKYNILYEDQFSPASHHSTDAPCLSVTAPELHNRHVSPYLGFIYHSASNLLEFK
jgi:hypothetical protein